VTEAGLFIGLGVGRFLYLRKRQQRTLKAVVPVQVQIAAALVIRRVLKHWGLLLLFESDPVSSREKEQRKTYPVLEEKKNIPCVFVQLPLCIFQQCLR